MDKVCTNCFHLELDTDSLESECPECGYDELVSVQLVVDMANAYREMKRVMDL